MHVNLLVASRIPTDLGASSEASLVLNSCTFSGSLGDRKYRKPVVSIGISIELDVAFKSSCVYHTKATSNGYILRIISYYTKCLRNTYSREAELLSANQHFID